MANFALVNNVNTTLASAITSPSQTSITLTSAAGLPTLSAGQIMALTLNDIATRQIFEILYVTAISGATLTVLRGQEGTAATTWAVGDRAYAAATAGVLLSVQSAAAAVAGFPGGRLTLVSGAPYPTANTTAVSNVYYTPAVNGSVPIYSGAALASLAFTEQLLTLTTGNNLSAHIYDVFAYNSGGTPLIGTGPAWSSLTARSAAIDNSLGIWTNTAGIVLTNGATTTGTIPANQATYLGSVYCTANAQTSVNLTPAGASHGTANVMGLYNAYNRQELAIACNDTGSPTLTDATWAQLGTSDTILFVDGLGQSMVDVDCIYITTSAINQGTVIKWGFSIGTATTPNVQDQTVLQIAAPANSPFFNFSHRSILQPTLGATKLFAMCYAGVAANVTYNGGNDPGHKFIAKLVA